MKLIAGSILAGFGLMELAFTVKQGIFSEIYFSSDSPMDILAILFIAGGIGLIGWGIWEARKKGTN